MDRGTRDDAAGEAFDKIGRLIGLSYPAGPEIEKIAKNGDPKSFTFPRPMIKSLDFDFSFQVLKALSFVKYKKFPQYHQLLLPILAHQHKKQLSIY